MGGVDMEKFLEITYLFDFYQELLTEKQRELITQYFFEDLSLGELAEQHNISRQSIFDTIKKAQAKLIDYEAKLGLWAKYQRQQKMIAKLQELSSQAKQGLDENGKAYIHAMDKVLAELNSEM